MRGARLLTRGPVVALPEGLTGAELRVRRPAIYVLGREGLGVLYVGQTHATPGVASRIRAHLASPRFRPARRRPTWARVLWLRCACALDHVERRLIAVLRPALNALRPAGREGVHAPGLWCPRCTALGDRASRDEQPPRLMSSPGLSPATPAPPCATTGDRP